MVKHIVLEQKFQNIIVVRWVSKVSILVDVQNVMTTLSPHHPKKSWDTV